MKEKGLLLNLFKLSGFMQDAAMVICTGVVGECAR